MEGHLEVPRLYERRRSYSKTWGERLVPLRDYLRVTDLHGYKFLAESNRVLLERIIWAAFLLGMMGSAMYTIHSNLNNFLEAPTAISEVPIKRTVDEIPFPAVMICMANRFSKRKTMAFAERLYKQHNSSASSPLVDSVDEIFETLKGVAHLIDFSSPQDSTGLQQLHSLLNLIYNNSYPIDVILKELQVPCTDILVHCAWMDTEVNCSEVFELRKTYAGQCCIFNYLRPTVAEFQAAMQEGVAANVTTPLSTVSNSSQMFKGLSAVIDYTPEDDLITLTNTFDTVVGVFNGKDYPDVVNGAIRQTLVAMGTETYIQLFPKYVRAAPELRDVRSDIRNCVFDDEISLIYKDYYTYGECVLTCRLSDIIRMCGCTPPSMVMIHNATYCDLADLLCLIRFNEKWVNSDINGYDYSILNPYCTSCYPTCNYLRYELQTSYTVIREISQVSIFGRRGAQVEADPSKHSVIHVYYGDKYVKEFEQAMISTWYDLLSSLGGIVALITGGSLISIVEVSYLISGRFGAHYLRVLKKKYFSRDRHRRRMSDESSVQDDDDVPPVARRRTSVAFVNQIRQ